MTTQVFTNIVLLLWMIAFFRECFKNKKLRKENNELKKKALSKAIKVERNRQTNGGNYLLTQEEVNEQKKKFDEWLNHFKKTGVARTSFGIWLACARWNGLGTKDKPT
jgi:predicted Holliday junction resolvase-like endonuclease